tara:strand:+ start:408 stop:776 length:369 start_codon:yes stop_codon:yes gene_type:complete
MRKWKRIKYFTVDEFDSPDLKGSGVNMDMAFVEVLDKVREIAETPFKVNSGYRSASHNKKVKGSPNSSHLRGLAADIHCTDSDSRLRIVYAAIEKGVNRIGVGKTFIHLDTDPNKVSALWVY